MGNDTPTQVRDLVDAVYRSDSHQVLATLIRLLGDFETAEEAVHNAFVLAIEQRVRDGVPANPRAWLIVHSLSITVSAAAPHRGSHPS